jgi:hypothetical protein
MTALRQLARQFPIPAAQVQNGLIAPQPRKHAPDARLDAMPGCRKGVGETGIKIPIYFDQLVCGVRVHREII